MDYLLNVLTAYERGRKMSKLGFDVDFDVARDNLAIYYGRLGRTIALLEERPDANQNELDAYRKEFSKVGPELMNMMPEDQALINRALYIYPQVSHHLMETYLT